MKKALMLIVALHFYSVVMAQTNNVGSRNTLKGLTGLEVVINDPNPDLEKAGLYASQLQTDAELRLRMAGIRVKTEQENIFKRGEAWLDIRLISVKVEAMELWVYGLNVSLNQLVLLEDPKVLPFRATTWSTGSIGYVGTERVVTQIRNAMKDRMDEFINAWLSVNPKDPQ